MQPTNIMLFPYLTSPTESMLFTTCLALPPLLHLHPILSQTQGLPILSPAMLHGLPLPSLPLPPPSGSLLFRLPLLPMLRKFLLLKTLPPLFSLMVLKLLHILEGQSKCRFLGATPKFLIHGSGWSLGICVSIQVMLMLLVQGPCLRTTALVPVITSVSSPRLGALQTEPFI